MADTIFHRKCSKKCLIITLRALISYGLKYVLIYHSLAPRYIKTLPNTTCSGGQGGGCHGNNNQMTRTESPQSRMCTVYNKDIIMSSSFELFFMESFSQRLLDAYYGTLCVREHLKRTISVIVSIVLLLE